MFACLFEKGNVKTMCEQINMKMGKSGCNEFYYNFLLNFRLNAFSYFGYW